MWTLCVWGGGAAVGTSAESWRTRRQFFGARLDLQQCCANTVGSFCGLLLLLCAATAAGHYAQWRLWVDLVSGQQQGGKTVPRAGCGLCPDFEALTAASTKTAAACWLPDLLHGMSYHPSAVVCALLCLCSPPCQMTTIPFDWIVLGCLGLQDSNSQLAW